MKDKFGIELEVGHRIVYATKWGSSPVLQLAVVQKLTDNGKAKVLPDGTFPDGTYWSMHSTHISIPDRVVFLGWDNQEDIAFSLPSEELEALISEMYDEDSHSRH